MEQIDTKITDNAVYLNVWKIEREGKVPIETDGESFISEKAAFKYLNQAVKRLDMNLLQIDPPVERALSHKHSVVWRLDDMSLDSGTKVHKSLVRVVVESTWSRADVKVGKGNNLVIIGDWVRVTKLERFIITQTQVKVHT